MRAKAALPSWLCLLLALVAASSSSASQTAEGTPVVSFINEVMPLLAKAGCSAGACHAKPEGQNNFKLSVFGYDPRLDFNEIVNDARSRRVFLAAPEQSLLLLKASGQIPHEGGARISVDSPQYRTLLDWIKQGAPFDASSVPRLKEISVEPKHFELAPGELKQLKVTATFSDSSTRDVTELALYQSNEKELVEVDDVGRLTASRGHGEAVIVVNYMGAVDVARPLLSPPKKLSQEAFAAFPIHNEIDRFVYQRLQSIGVLPSGQCSDAQFIRRAALDCIGRLPTIEEARAFHADKGERKRSLWIQKLLAEKNYADHWAVKWGDLIRPNPSRVGVKPVFLLDLWLRDMFRRNVPYDRMVKELLMAEGSSHQYGPVAVLRDKRDPADASGFVSQIFLGVRMECARCHHHPSEKWAQEDYYQLAAFFGKMRSRGQGISAPISGEPEVWWYDSGGKGVLHPINDTPMVPKAPDGPEFAYQKDVDPRSQLLDWMLSRENPFFAKAIVNRIWGEFLGKGIVDPVDDFRVSNPASNPELLEWLAADFASHGYDLKHLMTTIMESAAYQRSSEPNDSNLTEHRNFARFMRRRLPAEVLSDAVADLTGVRDEFTGLPSGSRAVQTWNHKLTSEFLDAFGRPNPSLECPCERERKPTVVQSLHLMNSNGLQAKLASSKGRVAQYLAAKKPSEEILSDVYLQAYSREPKEEEKGSAMAYLMKPEADRKAGIEDLVWALVNTAEFVFNH